MLFKVISLFDDNDPEELPLWKAARKEYIDHVRRLGVAAADAHDFPRVDVVLPRLASRTCPLEWAMLSCIHHMQHSDANAVSNFFRVQ